MRGKRHNFHLPIRTEATLREFARLALGVTIPDVQVCADHQTPWQAFAAAYFAKSSMCVWEASRGFGGKSFLLAALGLTEALTLKANVNLLGGSGEQAGRVHEYMTRFWQYQNAPKQRLASDPIQRETRLVGGNRVQVLMASSKSVRGPHPERLRVDEVDEMDVPLLDAALGQTMARESIPAQTVLSSTHQYPDGAMTEVLQRAAAKGWPVYKWCYKESSAQPGGWLSPDEVERKRGEVTAAMWETEYNLQEPSPESRAIQPEAVKATFRRDLGEYEGNEGEYIEAEPPEKGAHYIHGADWARKQDWTIIDTIRIDTKPARRVAWERTGRRPWPVMVERLEARIKRFGGQAAHDGTGIGDVVAGYMTQPATAVMMVGRPRSDMLSQYIAALEHGELVSPWIRFAETEHRFASVDDVYGAGHLPDSISAAALAWLQQSKGGSLLLWDES